MPIDPLPVSPNQIDSDSMRTKINELISDNSSVTVGNVPPTGAEEGYLWFDVDNAATYVYIGDPTNAWAQANSFTSTTSQDTSQDTGELSVTATMQLHSTVATHDVYNGPTSSPGSLKYTHNADGTATFDWGTIPFGPRMGQQNIVNTTWNLRYADGSLLFPDNWGGVTAIYNKPDGFGGNTAKNLLEWLHETRDFTLNQDRYWARGYYNAQGIEAYNSDPLAEGSMLYYIWINEPVIGQQNLPYFWAPTTKQESLASNYAQTEIFGSAWSDGNTNCGSFCPGYWFT
jgi:hypothetical protein